MMDSKSYHLPVPTPQPIVSVLQTFLQLPDRQNIDMDGIALTKAEADDHLRRLREKRGMMGDNNDVSNSVLLSSLNEALALVSDQLYTTPTHFLLELIQNADDNTYRPGAVPRLHLSLYREDGMMFFRSDCNEIGFTFQQLDALMRIGKSTKKAITDGRKGYIGEKGIGFKSVFKVADVVHIASGRYEFKLDRRQTIGMMLPILSHFPSDHRVGGHTQVLLEIKRDDDYRQIKRELEGIEPQMLLFMRKLKQVEVSVDGHTRVYKRGIKSSDDGFGGEINTISETTDGVTKMSKYLIHRQTVKDLPSDPRRAGVNVSEVVLAFAVKGKATPITKPQHVFAFLPVDGYGFPFLIHADFLLIASRESLQYYSHWNLALRKGIQDAVVAMIVDRLVHLSEVDDNVGLCYRWPKYLARRRGGQPFWDDLHQNILYALRQKEILWSWDKDADLQKPTELRYVPEAYRFEGGTLFDIPSISSTHLSFVYDGVFQHLKTVGVSELSLNDLCEEFCQWVSAAGVAGLKEKSGEWHNKVCQVFRGQGIGITQRLQKLPIIPLRDGSWAKATKPHLYLPSPNRDELVPSGVGSIWIVDRDAAQDLARRGLYKDLGVQEYNPRQVCALILEVHRELAVAWTGRSRQDLVDDALYLFKHRSELDYLTPPPIFFVCEKNGKVLPRKFSRIYIVDPEQRHGVIAKYKDTAGSPFAVLSNTYEATLRQDGGAAGAGSQVKEFRRWLLRKTSVFTTTPDLLRNSSLTPEWQFLRDQDVLDLLYTVRETLSTTLFPSPKLLEAVPRLELRCLDGISRNLGGLAVPTPDLRRACPHLDFADLPEPTCENWKFLSDFGVVIELGTSAILREFEALRRMPIQDVSTSAVKRLYEELNPRTNEDKRQILAAFRKQPLVFVPRPSPGRWLSHNDCVWTAPSLLSRVAKLRSYYPTCKGLFRSLLGVQVAGTRHVVDEFCQPFSSPRQQEDDMQQQRRHFEPLLSLLHAFHNGKSRLTDDQICRIRSAEVFPVLAGQSPSVQVEMRAMADGRNWYIPDSVALETAFRGKIDMLKLPVQSVKRLAELFEVLWCKEEFLSVCVGQVIRPVGMAVRNVREEEDMRQRLKSVLCLTEHKQRTPRDLSPVRVLSVPSITVTMSLDGIEVTVDNKLVTINDREDTIDIYLRDGINQTHRPMVTFELVEYFKKLIGFDDELTNLVSVLMGAPIDSLHIILEQQDIIFPHAAPSDYHDVSSRDGGDSPASGATLPGEKDDAPSKGNYDPHGGGDDVGGLEKYHHQHSSASALTERDTEQGSRPANAAPMHRNDYDSTPLRELISSHQSRTEGIMQRVTAALIHWYSGSWLTLPIRTKIPENDTNLAEVLDQRRVERPVVATSHHTRSVGVGDGRYHIPHSSNSSANRRRRSFHTTTGMIQRPDDMTAIIRTREIGYHGELFIYEIFAKRITDWSFNNWTSRLRSEAGHPPFLDRERDFADFTYVDTTGQMRGLLQETGIVAEPNTAAAQWSNTTTFHLEVKSTLGHCAAEPMYVSQNQVDKMRLFDKKPDNAYILLRVFNLEEDDGSNIGVRYFCDPWSLYMSGVLDFRSDGGYKVRL